MALTEWAPRPDLPTAPDQRILMASADDINANYADLVRAVRELGQILRPAVAARWEAPPGVHVNTGRDVPDPTGAIVADPRRSALSDEVVRASGAVVVATAGLDAVTAAVDLSLRKWEGMA